MNSSIFDSCSLAGNWFKLGFKWIEPKPQNIRLRASGVVPSFEKRFGEIFRKIEPLHSLIGAILEFLSWTLWLKETKAISYIALLAFVVWFILK